MHPVSGIKIGGLRSYCTLSRPIRKSCPILYNTTILKTSQPYICMNSVCIYYTTVGIDNLGMVLTGLETAFCCGVDFMCHVEALENQSVIITVAGWGSAGMLLHVMFF